MDGIIWTDFTFPGFAPGSLLSFSGLDLFGSIGIGLLVFQAVGSFRIFRMFRILRLSGSLDLLVFQDLGI